MKKVFLFLAMLLFAFVGTMRADEVTIGDPTATTTNVYLPGYSLYEKAISQQMYTADEIGMAGTINTLSMWLKNTSSYARNFNVYMKEVDVVEFASTSAWVSMSDADLVGSFSLANGISSPVETAVELTAPFEYTGAGTLVICLNDVTGSWSSGAGSVVMTTTEYQALYAYRDGTSYDPSNPGVNGTRLTVKSVIKLDITPAGPGGAPTTTPDVLDLGYRPNGAWMAPYVFTINGTGTTVNALDLSGNYFTYNAELPATLTAAHPLEVTLTTGEAEEGPVNSTLTVLYSENSKDAAQFEITAYAYDPVDGDVWETAIEVEDFPYSDSAPEMIYKNYDLPSSDAPDAVYKLTFDEDVLLSASTEAGDGVAYLYPEDFKGEGGPTADNMYTGTEVHYPTSMWFYYDYSGSEGFFGSSSSNAYMFGYEIPKEYLQEYNLGNCAITTVESAARYGTFYDLVILQGGDTPDLNNIVYYQEFSDYNQLSYFDVELDEPLFLGDEENIWVMFYSDSPYAAYTGSNPYDTQYGKYWSMNLAATTPTWSNNTTRTPVIYTLFLEIPTGREIAVGANDLKMREVATTTEVGNIGTVEANVNGTSKAQEFLARHQKNATRGYEDIEDMFVQPGTYYLVMASEDQQFDVNISIDEAPAPEQAVIYYPYDGETNVTTPYYAEWSVPEYTTEIQVLLGTQYPPQTAIIDWTDNLEGGIILTDLMNNQSYFMQVNVRNSTGTTMGEVIAFTTQIDPVQGLEAEATELYPGDAAVLTWEANRSFQGYNVYMYDGVEISKLTETPITETTYTVEGLEYNMGGYQFGVTAVYDAGESEIEEAVTVYMTGNGFVSGHVYDTDTLMPIAGATVEFRGLDEYNHAQVISFTTDEDGAYEGLVLAGIYSAFASKNGYAEGEYDGTVVVDYEGEYEGIDIITHEYYAPLSTITATEDGDEVLVEWGWAPEIVTVDFETGDFSQAEFTLPATYPWTVTTTHPHEGTYCMKSTCEGVSSGVSSIEVTYEAPADGMMGFWVRVSTEASYDKFHFYIDGVEKGSALSGQVDYAYKEFPVTAGVHVYKFEYAKDSSVNSNDDCVYVDDITLYKEPTPAPGGNHYDFDDNTFQGWTTIDANNDGYDWVTADAIGGVYLVSGASLAGTGHNDSEGMVCSGSYSNASQSAITPDNFLVSPAKIAAQAGAVIDFYACGQDANYAAEHFGVFVSTGSNTSASDFTMVQEWTMTSKRGAQAADEATTMRGTRDQGNWYQKTVDLSAYAGQEIWVAIRHFNCNDQFILNVDDITLSDGTDAVALRNDRSFQSFNLYRRNNVTNETPELIASGLTDMEYTDDDWAELPYGEYQWGISATYEGYAPVPERSRETATYGFEGGSLDGWTNLIINADGGEWLNSDDNLGGYDYSELAHTGTGFAMCYSYVDYDGAYDTDAFLVSPQKYTMDASSSINFWADNANDDYPEDFSVWVSTAATPTTASDFTEVWSGGAKATVSDGAKVRHSNTRYENWREHTISLASYAGQEIWIAFRDVNYDMYEIWIDDVTITYAGSAPVPPTPPAPTGDGESEVLWSNVIEKDMEATIAVTVTLNNGQSPVGDITVTVAGGEEPQEMVMDDYTVVFDVRKGVEYTVTAAGHGYTTVEETVFVEEDVEISLELEEIVAPVEGLYVSPTGWAKWEGKVPGPTPGPTPPGPTPPTPTGEWYYYDDGTFATNVGLGGGQFQFGVMFPAGTYEGNTVTKVSKYDATGQPMTGTVTIYNDGTTAPATAVGTANCTFSGTVEDFVEVEFATPVTIDPTKNLWVVFDNVSGDAHPAACSNDVTGDANGRWVCISGTWYDMASVGVSGKTNMVRAYVATGAKGEVHEISVPQFKGSNGTLMTMGGNRAPISYKVMLDGEYLGETELPFYQFDVEGMEEGSEHVARVAPLYATGMGDWMEYTWTYTACSNFGGMEEFGAEVVTVEDQQNIVVSWTLPEGSTPTPPTPPTPPAGDETFDFDDNTMMGWTSIDADGDGNGWVSSANPGIYHNSGVNLSGTGHNSSEGYVISGSYANQTGVALTPNNYLVAPAKTQRGSISFWACGQDANYVAEHFGVAVATGDAVSDFVTIQEWTMTAKSEGAMSAGRGGQTRAQGSWHQYTVDLSAYAGQDIWVAIRHFNCTDMFILNVDDIELTAPAKRDNRNMWDLVTTFNAAEGGQYGIVTDGQYFYTSNWGYSSAAHNFWKYDLEGNQIEGFEISGCGTLRGMTFDGEYVYGVANASTIYCVDLNNHTLVSTTTSAYGAMRGITYDSERDGFWVIGNWSGNLTLIDRTGAIVQTGPAPTSASDLAYYKDPDGVEHVYCFNNGTNDVDDYNITTGTMTTAVFNFNSTPGFDSGSSGGCHVATYDGKTCFIGDIQQSPNLIGIYELDSAGPVPPVPPTPTGDIVGAVLYRDGEFVGIFDANTTTYTDEDMEPGEYSYSIRVIYGGDYDVTYYAMSCPETVDVTIGDAVNENNEVINSIYPNPTSNDLHINAEAMTHVTVFNAMGQMVYDQDVNTDSMILNMGQYEAGVYMVRIDTKNGNSVKRITVIK